MSCLVRVVGGGNSRCRQLRDGVQKADVRPCMMRRVG